MGPYPTTFWLFANVICFTALLILLNALVGRWRPRWVMSQAELLIIYSMLAIGTSLTSIDFLDVLIPMIGHPTRHATPYNRWETLFMQYLPDWFLVRGNEALTGWYTGMTSPYAWWRLQAWLLPLAAWGVFILVLLWVMLCLNVVRKQWTQHERLSYPIILRPLEMTDDPARFVQQPLLWAGFAVSGGICILNGLHVLYLYLPYIPVKMLDISPMFPSPPWDAIGWTTISSYPFSIGLPISGSWTMNTIWLPMVISGAVKVAVLHYRGLRVYRRALAFIDSRRLPDRLSVAHRWLVAEGEYI